MPSVSELQALLDHLAKKLAGEDSGSEAALDPQQPHGKSRRSG